MLIYPYRGSTENLLSNGGFETNTTGWTTGGSNTIETSSDQSKFGSQSLKATYQDDIDLAYFPITLTTEATYTMSVFIYIPSNYDGTSLRWRNTSFAGVTGTTNVVIPMSTRDEWQRVVLDPFTLAADGAGNIAVSEQGDAPTAGRFVYIDGVQVESGSSVTPYVETDGSTATRAVGPNIAHLSGIIRPVGRVS